jgi:alpha-amylase/alpha-mannosidase (GH57 family)
MSTADLPCAVLWWHFHQPDYRDPAGNLAHFPWVRMHATRGYTDLVVQAMERGPRGMTFNMVPSLADQLEDLAEGRVEDRHHRAARLLAEGDDAARKLAFQLHAAPTPRPMIELPRFDELRTLAASGTSDEEGYEPTTEEAIDAVVLFHLSWFGFTISRTEEVRALRRKQRGYTADDVQTVLRLSRAMAGGVLPRMAQGLRDGVLFLTATPYTHPILPLLIDTSSAHEATTDGGAPPHWGRPDDAARQVTDAIARHEALFGERPRAFWPAEGSLSEAAARCLADAGVEVAASDEELLRKSLERDDRGAHLRPWRHTSTGLHLLFRDRRLSDDWGFVYRDMTPEDAAQSFVAGIEERAEHGTIVPVILDGENPFEQYPGAGRDHLDAFSVAIDGRVRLISPEQAVRRDPRPLEHLASGSWIHASFDIWAGDDEDRRGWALLQAVREAIDLDALDDERREQVEQHLFAAEGSDWFWWYGPEFSTPDKLGFDQCFRDHLRRAAEIADVDFGHLPPLEVPIVREAVHDKRRHPLPIGRPDAGAALGAWSNALVFGGSSDGGAMHRGAPLINEARAMGDIEKLFVRLHVRDDVTRVDIRLAGPDGEVSTRVDRTDGGHTLEAWVRWTRAGIHPGGHAMLSVTAWAGDTIERAPALGDVTMDRPAARWFEA